jgi:tetratricopeptide (TPR) repeat protein
MSEPRGAAASSDSVAGLIAQVESLRKTRPDQAWALLARQFPVALRGASALHRGELWRLRGHLQRSLSRWSAAAQAYRRAEDWFRRAGDLREQGRCAIGLVDTLMYLGRYGEAERVAARGRRALARVGDPHAQARLLNNEGNLHHRLDRPDRALERYRKARRFLARAGDRRGSGMVDGNIANCLSLLGRTPEARRLYRGARRASLAGGFEVVALTSLDRAEILLRLGDHDGAFEEAHSATTAFRELGMDYERAKAEVFASLAQFRLGRPAAARSGLERALADFQSEGNAVWVGEALIGLATSWWSQGSAAAAAPLLAAAAGRFAWAKDREREGAALALLAQARLESGARGAAANLARARRVAGRRPSPRLEHLLLVAAAEAARHDGDRAAARRYLTRAARASERLAAGILDEQWRASFWGEWSIPHRELAALEMDADRPEAAFEALERGRGRVLASAWRRTRSPRALRGWAASRLARDRDRGTRSGSPGAMVGVVAPPATLRRALSSSIAPSFRARDVGDRLADGAALLDFAFHRGALSAFVVRRTGIEMRPCLVAERELARISHDVLFELRRAALEPREQRAASPALAAALEELASLVLWPLLERGTPDRLAVVPSGPLGRIPWAALPLPDGQPLCAAASLTLVPGLRLGLASRAPRQGNAPALIVAVESEGLESVMREAEALRRALPDAVLLSGPEATAERFLELAPKAGWIHFAGHGVHESGRSGLRLQDRWLLAEEMDGLRLAARGVALSACQTARALVQPGEEWFGFPRNLLLAGAGAVLAAQWDVDDASAARLMGDVYGRLASGERIGPAVSGAQAALAANGVHPLDWAGFVILGGPGAGDASPEGIRAAAGAC